MLAYWGYMLSCTFRFFALRISDIYMKTTYSRKHSGIRAKKQFAFGTAVMSCDNISLLLLYTTTRLADEERYAVYNYQSSPAFDICSDSIPATPQLETWTTRDHAAITFPSPSPASG